MAHIGLPTASRPQAGSPPRDRYRGCLLGGAVGDALGAPVEFKRISDIRRRYGEDGITELDEAYGRVGAITDDTQMTLFTAEGLLRAISRRHIIGDWEPAKCVHRAYLRWLRTQGGRQSGATPAVLESGWLVDVLALHVERAPGTTCLVSLRGGRRGTIDEPLNESKGCGGVMRAAPAGLLRGVDHFTLGCQVAAITHGHPSGYLSAGALAMMVADLVEGGGLEAAVLAAIDRLRHEEDHAETVAALDGALLAWGAEPPTSKAVGARGGGWVAEEALAIAVYCALAAERDFATGIRLAVNHSGDSDSTGAIAGNLLGAMLGVDAIPTRWLERLELHDEIESLADDLWTEFRDDSEWRERYPPN